MAERISLEVPATLSALSTVRMVLGGLGARLDFSLDDLDDLFLATDGLLQAALEAEELDAVMLLSRAPQANCVLKAPLITGVLFGPGARLAGYIRNDWPVGMVRRAVEELRGGGQLLLFPEGTRTARGHLNPFRGAISLIARQAGVPVQTLFIEADSAFLGKGWPLSRRPELPLRYRVRLGRRFDPPRDLHGFMRELEQYCAREMAEAPAAALPVPVDVESRPA